jgi:hypothetical protein
MLGTTRLGQRQTLLLAYAAVLLAAVSCQIVAGIETRKLDPLTQGCSLPSGGSGPQVRVANLYPSSDVVDLCLRPSGTTDWGRPLLLNGGVMSDGGPGCADTLGAAGFAYGNVSVPFSAPAAKVDVKFVTGGSTCADAAKSESDGLSLASNVTTTLIYAGGNGVSAQVIALPEADNSDPASQRLRLIHVAPGTSPLDVGLMDQPHLPAKLQTPLLSQPISFGQTLPPGTTTSIADANVQDNGYLALPGGLPLNLGASIDGGDGKAVLVYFVPAGTATTGSMYLIGVGGGADTAHPLRALVCSEDGGPGPNSILIPCTPSQLSTISVDMFNPALYGPNSPYFTQRQSLVPAAIAKRDADVMCLVEVDQDVDRNNILSQATSISGGTGPYGYMYTDTTLNLSTPPNNPKDQNGNTPPAPTSAPCGSVGSSYVNAALTCAEQHCSTKPPGDPTGQLLGSTDCLSSNCAAAFLNVQGQSLSCYDCISVYIASNQSFQSTENSCTTDTRPPLGFNGAENSLILSKYPLKNTAVWVLPSTLYRRSILYAQVVLEDQTIDFYCGFLITTLNASVLPYNGTYGNGATDSETGWDNEQTYQAQQLVQWVHDNSQGAPAIVVGDWRSSKKDTTPPPAGASAATDLNAQTMNTVFATAGGWTAAVATGGTTTWVPQCNFCPAPENPYNQAESYFVSQPFLVNWPGAANATTDESLLYTENTLPLGTADAGTGPISPYYGVNVRVIRPK